MDNPRLTFYFDEIPFWRLVSVLILIALLWVAVLLFFAPQLNTYWGGWRSIPAAIHATVPVDYHPTVEDSLPAVNKGLLQEIQKSP